MSKLNDKSSPIPNSDAAPRDGSASKPRSSLDRLRELTARVISVPRDEVKELERAYQRRTRGKP